VTVVFRALGLAAVYLLVLTSVDPGDVAVGLAIGFAIAVALRPQGGQRSAVPLSSRVLSAAVVAFETAVEIVRGSWRVARFCLGGPAQPGFVEIPRADRSPANVALWGVLTGEAPDEVVVDENPERGVLVVHLVDASDPEAVRARHREAYERWQRKVVG
jgi:multisubunit Na+/H+ antiporter MnhE subunit